MDFPNRRNAKPYGMPDQEQVPFATEPDEIPAEEWARRPYISEIPRAYNPTTGMMERLDRRPAIGNTPWLPGQLPATGTALQSPEPLPYTRDLPDPNYADSMSIGYDPFKKTKPIDYFKAKRKAVQNNRIWDEQQKAKDAYDQIIAEGNTQIGQYDSQIQDLRGQQPGLLMQGAIPQRTVAAPSLGESLAQGIAGLFQRGQANNVNNAVAQSSQRRAQEQDQYNAAVYNQGENNKQARFKMLDQQISDLLRQRGDTANDVSNARMGQARDQYALDRTEATIQGAYDRNNASILGRREIAGNKLTYQQKKDYDKSAEGQYQSHMDWIEKNILDPNEKAAAQIQATNDYQANKGKEAHKQKVANTQLQLKARQLEIVKQELVERTRHNKATEKISQAQIDAAWNRAVLTTNASITRTGMMVNSAEYRQGVRNAFEQGLFDQGLKIPRGAYSETPEQKQIGKRISELHDLIKMREEQAFKDGEDTDPSSENPSDIAQELIDLRNRLGIEEGNYRRAGVKRPLAPAPAGGK